MLVKEAADGTLKAVRGIDPEGKAQTVKPTPDTLASLLDVNFTDPALVAFFRKFVEPAQNPSETGISEGISEIYIMTGNPNIIIN